MQELASFIEGKSKQPESGKTSMILAGDFNIHRYPMGQIYLQKVFGQQPDFIKYIDLMESEYEDLLRTLSLKGSIEVTNCWDRDNPGQPCITYGAVED